MWLLLFTQVHIYFSSNILWIFHVLSYTTNFLKVCFLGRNKYKSQKMVVKRNCEDLWGHCLPQAQHLDLASRQLRLGADSSLSYQGSA